MHCIFQKESFSNSLLPFLSPTPKNVISQRTFRLTEQLWFLKLITTNREDRGPQEPHFKNNFVQLA